MVNVVFHTAFLGDLLLAIPWLRHVKKKWPDRPLILICRPGLKNFFIESKLVDEVFELDKKSTTSVKNFYQFIDKFQIELLFCPHQSFRSAWILRNVKAAKKISYKSWWGKKFFDELVPRYMNLPEALRLLHLMSPVDDEMRERLQKIRLDERYRNFSQREKIQDWPHVISTDLVLRVEPPADRVRAVTEKYRLLRPYVIVAPSSQWLTKRWTTSGFVELIQRLSKRGLNVYIIGTSGENKHCSEIETLATEQEVRVDVRSLAGQTDLIELHAIMSHAEVVVANDSGPMHMAAVAGRPVVAIFGPTTLELGYRPWSDLSYILQVNLPCRPCGKHGHNKCPIGTHDCMKLISASDVISGVDVMLEKSEAAGSTSASQIY